ncbi:hypothetical protein OUZ56_031659 [Daphnia magna]|uniref:Uncharacterized protein n=1 Tax=Daphnia magna TaxID=35525 RepID=A0ABQ9ZUV2_9CRUS|nr:hypothetical protein OUZ56_031659 [Daphnia magna]
MTAREEEEEEAITGIESNGAHLYFCLPSFPIVCAFIRATYRPPVQFLAIHFSIEEEKKKT